MTTFNFAMISAGFEHGGNVTHRHLDGHSRLLVYPFESQLGSRFFNDFLSSVERVQYRYPEFPEGLRPLELYEQMIDEEMKTFLRKREGSKFRNADLVLDEKDRISAFTALLGDQPHYPRRQVIEAFFRSTFMAWKNHHVKPTDDMVHVGYSPAIALDADRIIRDFPDVRIAHIIRNPFSAYRDTKRRPFPQPITRYLITWNIYHSTADMFARMYPRNLRIFRYEDLVTDKRAFMTEMAAFLGVPFEPSMLYPSWNGKELTENIAPWGTVLRSTEDYNRSMISELTDAERRQIANSTLPLARHFGYHDVDYLRPYYDAG
jgi:hypothetical protein